MAHDINNPNSSIQDSIVLLQDMIKDKEVLEILDNMKVCSDRIKVIVNSTRDQINNLGATKEESFRISEILENIDKVAKNELSNSKCKINISIKEDYVFYGIKTKLYQVLMNLVFNSIHAYKDANKEGTIDIEVYDNVNKFLITIQDYADGIPKEIEDKIFKTIITTRGQKGTGYGLFLTNTVIRDDLGGDIKFESTPCKGTKFYINIPKRKEED